MEERFARRLFLPDVRGAHRYLRVTWHEDTSTVVYSHWQDDICLASTPVSLEEASKLIGLIVGALKEAALKPVEAPPATPTPGGFLNRLRERFQPQSAQVLKLQDRLRHDRPMRESYSA